MSVGVASVIFEFFVASCRRLFSLAQSTKQEMEDGASPRTSKEVGPASSEEDSRLDVSNTAEEDEEKTPASGQFLEPQKTVLSTI